MKRRKRFNFELPPELWDRLNAGTKRTGISSPALAKLCIAGGLSLLEKGELKVMPEQPAQPETASA